MEFPIIINWNSPFLFEGMLGGIFFIFIQVVIENYASKQWRPWSGAAFCGVWSGSALFAYVPHKGR